MDLTQLKTQVMTMFMMKSAQRPVNGAQQQQNSEIWSVLYGMLMMNVVEYIFRHLPAAMALVQTWALAKWRPKQQQWIPLLGKTESEKEKINSITLTRIFQKHTTERETNTNVEKVDAVLEFICSIDNARHVRLDTRYTIGSTDDIVLTPDLKARVKQTSGGGGTNNIGFSSDESATIEIVLFSTTLKLTDIRAWIDDIHKNYVFEKNNKLGNNIYFFNEIPHEPAVTTDMSGDTPKKSYRWENMPKTFTFNMNEFKTSKSFTNVYGTHVDELKERLDLFIHHPEWYAERGIPHSLGIMLHGIPGAGKTSTIKAIAKDTHRHIFNLSLRPYTTQKQLLNLFFNEAVVVYKYDGSKTTYNIPMNRRVYVIEDIDCMTDVTLDRSLVPNGGGAAVDGDAVTLSFLLNLLDGVLETPGRILIITSNYPEKLDKALVRPGRIDVKIEFSHASREFIREMVSRFYSKTVDLETIPIELENIFTPAEVMESLCTYFKDSDLALKQLVQKRPAPPPTVVEDAGTSLASLGIESEAKPSQPPKEETPKNELIVFDTPLIPEPKMKIEPKYIKGDTFGDEMAWNTHHLQPPVDSFLTAGIKIDEAKYAEVTQSRIRSTAPFDITNAETINSILLPNPEFIEDLTDIHSFDPLGSAPSMWSDAKDITNPILDEATASKIIYPPPNIEVAQYRGKDIDGPI
jgi:hypothetical protein